MCQIEIPVLKDLGGALRHRVLIDEQIFVLGVHDTLPVPSLAGKTADRDDRYTKK